MATRAALVTVARHGRVAELTLDAPASLNALGGEMGDAFSAAVAALAAEPPSSLGAVVLGGAQGGASPTNSSSSSIVASPGWSVPSISHVR